MLETQLDVASLTAELTDYRCRIRKLEDCYQKAQNTIKKLCQQELRYRELYENSPIVIWEEDCSKLKVHVDTLAKLDEDTFIEYLDSHPDFILECIHKIRVIDVNQAALKFYKVESKAKLQNYLPELFNEAALDAFKDCLLAVRRGTTYFELETQTRDREGDVLVVSIRWLVPPGYEQDLSKVFVSTIDITPLTNAVQALRCSEQRYRQLAAMSPVGIFHCDTVGACSFLNQVAYHITGLDKQGQQNPIWLQTVHPEDKKNVESLWTTVCAKNIAFKSEMRFLHPDGTTHWGIVQIITMNNNNYAVEYLGTITDITKRQVAQDKLEAHQRQLQQADRAISLEEMATTISHELNQPLTAIVHYAGGCLQRLEGLKNVKDLAPALNKIVAQAEHAGAIIHRLRNFLHRGQLQRNSVSLNQIVKQSLVLLAVQLQREQVFVEYDYAHSLPKVKIDSVQVEQVIVNVIQNAIEAMHDMKERKSRLSICTKYLAPKEVAVIIIDNGPGITAENIDRIFQPFFTTQPKGMGIGLAISRSIIEAHAGRFEVRSQLGEGTQFSIILPVDEE